MSGKIISDQRKRIEDLERYIHHLETSKDDAVNHPKHYTSGTVECIDAIESALGAGFAEYCRGNAIKYIWRCGLKGDPVEDLSKAAWYINAAINSMKGGTE